MKSPKMIKGFRPYRSDHIPTKGLITIDVTANTPNVRPIKIPVAPRSLAKIGSIGLTSEIPIVATSTTKYNTKNGLDSIHESISADLAVSIF